MGITQNTFSRQYLFLGPAVLKFPSLKHMRKQLGPGKKQSYSINIQSWCPLPLKVL
jgi:hypothetical protein